MIATNKLTNYILNLIIIRGNWRQLVLKYTALSDNYLKQAQYNAYFTRMIIVDRVGVEPTTYASLSKAALFIIYPKSDNK